MPASSALANWDGSQSPRRPSSTPSPSRPRPPPPPPPSAPARATPASLPRLTFSAPRSAQPMSDLELSYPSSADDDDSVRKMLVPPYLPSSPAVPSPRTTNKESAGASSRELMEVDWGPAPLLQIPSHDPPFATASLPSPPIEAPSRSPERPESQDKHANDAGDVRDMLPSERAELPAEDQFVPLPHDGVLPPLDQLSDEIDRMYANVVGSPTYLEVQRPTDAALERGENLGDAVHHRDDALTGAEGPMYDHVFLAQEGAFSLSSRPDQARATSSIGEADDSATLSDANERPSVSMISVVASQKEPSIVPETPPSRLSSLPTSPANAGDQVAYVTGPGPSGSHSHAPPTDADGPRQAAPPVPPRSPSVEIIERSDLDGSTGESTLVNPAAAATRPSGARKAMAFASSSRRPLLAPLARGTISISSSSLTPPPSTSRQRRRPEQRTGQPVAPRHRAYIELPRLARNRTDYRPLSQVPFPADAAEESDASSTSSLRGPLPALSPTVSDLGAARSPVPASLSPSPSVVVLSGPPSPFAASSVSPPVTPRSRAAHARAQQQEQAPSSPAMPLSRKRAPVTPRAPRTPRTPRNAPPASQRNAPPPVTPRNAPPRPTTPRNTPPPATPVSRRTRATAAAAQGADSHVAQWVSVYQSAFSTNAQAAASLEARPKPRPRPTGKAAAESAAGPSRKRKLSTGPSAGPSQPAKKQHVARAESPRMEEPPGLPEPSALSARPAPPEPPARPARAASPAPRAASAHSASPATASAPELEADAAGNVWVTSGLDAYDALHAHSIVYDAPVRTDAEADLLEHRCPDRRARQALLVPALRYVLAEIGADAGALVLGRRDKGKGRARDAADGDSLVRPTQPRPRPAVRKETRTLAAAGVSHDATRQLAGSLPQPGPANAGLQPFIGTRAEPTPAIIPPPSQADLQASPYPVFPPPEVPTPAQGLSYSYHQSQHDDLAFRAMRGPDAFLGGGVSLAQDQDAPMALGDAFGGYIPPNMYGDSAQWMNPPHPLPQDFEPMPMDVDTAANTPESLGIALDAPPPFAGGNGTIDPSLLAGPSTPPRARSPSPPPSPTSPARRASRQDADDEAEWTGAAPKPKAKKGRAKGAPPGKGKERAADVGYRARVASAPGTPAAQDAFMQEVEGLTGKRTRKPTVRALESQESTQHLREIGLVKGSEPHVRTPAEHGPAQAPAEDSASDSETDEDEDDPDHSRPQLTKDEIRKLSIGIPYCHQCRTQNRYDKMRCTFVKADGERCGLYFCEKCITIRYPGEIEFNAYCGVFKCPRCSETCNCTSCCHRRGERYVSTKGTKHNIAFAAAYANIPIPRKPPRTKSTNDTEPSHPAPSARKRAVSSAAPPVVAASASSTARAASAAAAPQPQPKSKPKTIYEPSAKELEIAAAMALPPGAVWGTVYGLDMNRIGVGVVKDAENQGIVVQPIAGEGTAVYQEEEESEADYGEEPDPAPPAPPLRGLFVGKPRQGWKPRRGVGKQPVIPGHAYVGQKNPILVRLDSQAPDPLLSLEGPLTPQTSDDDDGAAGNEDGGETSPHVASDGSADANLPFVLAVALQRMHEDTRKASVAPTEAQGQPGDQLVPVPEQGSAAEGRVEEHHVASPAQSHSAAPETPVVVAASNPAAANASGDAVLRSPPSAEITPGITPGIASETHEPSAAALPLENSSGVPETSTLNVEASGAPNGDASTAPVLPPVSSGEVNVVPEIAIQEPFAAASPPEGRPAAIETSILANAILNLPEANTSVASILPAPPSTGDENESEVPMEVHDDAQNSPQAQEPADAPTPVVMPVDKSTIPPPAEQARSEPRSSSPVIVADLAAPIPSPTSQLRREYLEPSTSWSG